MFNPISALMALTYVFVKTIVIPMWVVYLLFVIPIIGIVVMAYLGQWLGYVFLGIVILYVVFVVWRFRRVK